MQAHADATHAYSQRFDAVLAHIDTNLEGDLSVETLSRVAHFSRFHFHRQFAAYVGVPVARYVQLMRLRRAAHRLGAQDACTVLDAAFDAGFDSPEAFSRAFKRAFGMAPSAFRRQPNWQIWSANFVVPYLSRKLTMQVRIIDFSQTRVAALEHRGPVGLVNESVAPNACGVRELVIPDGRCAVVRHVGSTDLIGESIYPVYRDWLPSSGEELRDHPLFFHYLSAWPETPQDQWQTDIYIPLV